MLSAIILFYQLSFAMEQIEVKVSQEGFVELVSPLRPSSEELFHQTPGLNLSSGGNRFRFFQIRGVGERSQFDTINQTPVSFFYNSIDLSEESHSVRLASNKAINISKTVRSVDYGSRGMGGAVEVNNCLGDSCFKRSLELEIDSFDSVGGGGEFSVDLGGLWSSQFSVYRLNSKGYQKNNFKDEWTSGRDESYLEWHNIYEGSISIESHHIFSQQNNGYDYFNHNNNYTSESDNPGKETNLTHGHSLIFRKEIGDREIQSITSITSSLIEQSYDEDWGNNPFWNQVSGWNSDYDYYSENKFLKNKIHQKLIFKDKGDLIGIHFFNMEDSLDNKAFKENALRSSLDRQSQMKSLAVILKKSENYKKWTFHLGFRAESQDRSLRGGGLDRGVDEKLWSSEFEINYSFKEKEKIILTISRGFRGGGFNLDSGLNPERQIYDSERLYLTELGYKKEKGSFKQEYKLFYMERKDMQLKSSFQDDPMDPSSFSYYTDNATSAKIYGLDIDLALKNNSWEFVTNLSGMASSFGHYSYGNNDLSGRDLPAVPRFSFYSLVKKYWNNDLDSSVVFYGQESFYFSNSHSQRSKAYQLVDIVLNYKKEFWSFQVFVKNLFDQRYSLRGFYFANEPPLWEEKLYTQPSPPRLVGLKVSYSF